MESRAFSRKKIPAYNEKTPLLVTSQPKKKLAKKKDVHFPEMCYPEMDHRPVYGTPKPYKRGTPRLIKQSRSDWIDSSDSEAEYIKDPSRRPEDSTIQAFMVVAIVIAVLAILAGIKGYHIYHGTEEREENRPKGGYY